MTASTKALSGPAKDKFLRSVVAEVDGLTGEVARDLTDQLATAISSVRVRRTAWERAIAAGVKVKTGRQAARGKRGPVIAADGQATIAAADAEAFDPYALNAIVVYSRQGRTALLAELGAIHRAEDLQALARAQHLGVDAAASDPVALRLAIIAGVERRIADRKAAAS